MMNMTRRNNNNDVKVGDTPADTVMGKAAGVGLNVGVLRFTVTYRITFHHLGKGLATKSDECSEKFKRPLTLRGASFSENYIANFL